MKKSILFICSAAVINGFIPTVMAGKFSLGGGVVVSPSPYKGHQDRVHPIPDVYYESDKFYWRALSLGYHLWDDGANQLSATAFYSPLEYRASDNNQYALKQLDNRYASIMAGFSYWHRADWGSIRMVAAGDILNKSNGILGDLAYLYPWQTGDWLITAGMGTEWSSERLNRYYYGISRAEASRSGLTRYRPGSSWSPYLELSLGYSLTSSWNASFAGRYTRLNSEVTDSPMVDKSYTWMLFSGITYQF